MMSIILPKMQFYMKKFAIIILICMVGGFPVTGAGDPKKEVKKESKNEVKKEEENPNVTNLQASIISDGKSIQLTWTPPSKSGVIIIARSSGVIDLVEKLYIADSLGKYPSGGDNGISTFVDTNLAEGTYFYSIVLVEQIKKRTVSLFPDQNYTTTPIAIVRKSKDAGPEEPEKKPVSDKKESLTDATQNFVTGLTLEKEGNSISMFWNPPVEAINGKTKYVVYRSTSSMSTLPLMGRAIKLAEVEHPAITFTDHDLTRSGTYYYGISVKQAEIETLPLQQDSSYKRYFFIFNKNKKEIEEKLTEEPGVIPDKQALATVTNIRYEITEAGIRIVWDPPVIKRGAVIYTIYKSKEPFNREKDSFSQEKSNVLGRVFHPQTFFAVNEIDPESDTFYAVTMRTETQEENYKVYENEAYLRLIPALIEKKAVKPGEKKEITENESKEKNIKEVETPTLENIPEVVKAPHDEIDEVLQTAYRQSKFTETVYRLQRILEKTKEPSSMGKISFYIGLSYFHNKQYKTALKYMLKPETSLFDAPRTDFWIKRSLNQIARGKE